MTRKSAPNATSDSTAKVNEEGSEDMAEHRVRKDNIIYIIPDDELFAKLKNDEAFISASKCMARAYCAVLPSHKSGICLKGTESGCSPCLSKDERIGNGETENRHEDDAERIWRLKTKSPVSLARNAKQPEKTSRCRRDRH